ncbi:glycosyltransferase family 2 protein [Dokdonella sp.]|uniref:glycosyltransferase family 2 protein n=1 Tax=Dokdonella sp. TaxID=2291710 RepID=UPI0031C11D04|nr:glycosyltransferase family 2 protein [Dokdonella sp.]
MPNPPRPGLSACIITLNEADRLAACLDSLAFCDELVVVDSGSTDGTRELARARGARVLERPFDGYRRQKDFAVQAAAHDWVLCLDADERVTPALRASIEAARARGFADAAGYRFARCTTYFGAPLRHGNAYPDRVLRLFDRRRGGWRGEREIHEQLRVDGPLRRLGGDLDHQAYRSLADQMRRMDRYSTLMAEHLLGRGKRARIAAIVFSPAWRFLRGYVLRLGFLDGWRGLVFALVEANYVRQKAIKHWLLARGFRLAH